MASGSEVGLIYDAAKKLEEQGRSVRVVSFPSWELFEKQDAAYRESVLPKKISGKDRCRSGSQPRLGTIRRLDLARSSPLIALARLHRIKPSSKNLGLPLKIF